MTKMLASVRSSAEARAAIAGGADIIDLKDPERGALGALPVSVAGEIVHAISAHHRLTSATIGDIPNDEEAVCAAVRATATTGVDFVKIGLFEHRGSAALLDALGELAGENAPLVLVLFADREADFSLLPLAARRGFKGVMLDTAGKDAGNLRTCLGDAAIKRFVDSANAHGLLSGLAGSLSKEDIAPLLAFAPTLLGFRAALCERGKRTHGLSRARVADIRTEIPLTGNPKTLTEPADMRPVNDALGVE